MTDKKQSPRQNVEASYRPHINPNRLSDFLEGNGSLGNWKTVAEKFDYDWHARKLTFDTHFLGHVLMQATAYESTRDHQWAAQHDALFAAHGAAVDISVSGLAQANKTRPIEPYFVLMQQVLSRVAQLPHRRLRALDKTTWQGITDLLKRTDIFDATTLSLPPKLADWSPAPADDQAAVKLQMKIDGTSGHMKQILLTPATGNDSRYFASLLGDLEAQQGQIFLFDAGYWRLETYQDMVQAGHNFVTKRAGQITPRIVEERDLPEGDTASGYTVLQDAIVQLDDDEQTSYRMLRVRLTNDEQITLITSLLQRDADDICLLYRYRWTIEIVFRWLKQTLSLDHMMSHDPTGILRQILTALMMWGLLVIANQDDTPLSPKQLWRQLQADLHQAILEFGFRLGLAHQHGP